VVPRCCLPEGPLRMKLRLDASLRLSLYPERIWRDCSSRCPPWGRVYWRDRTDAVLRCCWQDLFRMKTNLGRILGFDEIAEVVVGVESRWLCCGYSLWMRMP
jgi:hypothetical protein